MQDRVLTLDEKAYTIHMQCQHREVIDYQVKMLQYQKDFFGWEMRWIQAGENQTLIWLYPTNERLINHLQKEQLEAEDYIRLLTKIYQRIFEGRKYLLDDQRWYIDLDYLLLGKTLNMIYIPIKSYMPDMAKQWLELITRLARYTDPYEPIIRKLNQQLHVLLREGTFNLEEIKKIVEEVKG